MDPQEVRRLIEEGLPGCTVTASGDGRHFEATVVSDAFEGKSVIQQHRLVYATLGEHLANDAVHALSLQTYTPSQWRRLQGG